MSSTTLTGTEFATYTVNDATLSAIRAEYIINRAINLIVLYGKGSIVLSPMTGTAGAKTLTVTQQQKGAIELVARAIYASFEKNAANNQTVSVGSINVSAADLMSNPAVLSSIKEASDLLQDTDWSQAFI